MITEEEPMYVSVEMNLYSFDIYKIVLYGLELHPAGKEGTMCLTKIESIDSSRISEEIIVVKAWSEKLEPASLVSIELPMKHFDKIILMGLLIYLNDQDIIQTLRKVITVASTNCLLMIREPVGIDERLTIKEHFSEDLEQFYNAIYRTEKELLLMFAETIGRAGFKLTDSGYVYEQPDMNNHSDTIQKWYILERRKGD
jgi:hypothetical protein